MRLKDAEWAKVFDGLEALASENRRTAMTLRYRKGNALLCRSLEKQARAAEALAMKLGHRGEVAAFLGVRSSTKRRKHDTAGDPRREYLDAGRAESLLRRDFEPGPGSPAGGAELVASYFVIHCDSRMARPDAFTLAEFAAGMGWGKRQAVAAEADERRWL